jgi:TetR/AcrR family transcriptional regulator, tetracycline repressor protein
LYGVHVAEHPDLCGSDLPPQPWARAPQRPPRRRRELLTQQAIVDAALAVLDADGLDLLSMRHVARTLHVSAGALYWHVGSKDGLLDLIFDRVIGEVHVPDPDPDRWEEQLKEVARGERSTILAHRDIIRLSIGRIPMGPSAVRHADRVLAILRTGGVPDALAVAAQQLLHSIVIGFAIDETGEGGHPPADGPPPDEAAAMASDYLASLPSDRFPHLVAVAAHIAEDNADEHFELLLELFVDGLAQRARS